MSVKFLSHLHFCNQNISDFPNQITYCILQDSSPLPVTETKFKLAEAVKEIGLCKQLWGVLGDRTMDVNVIRSPSLHLSSSLCKLALFSSVGFSPKAKTQVCVEGERVGGGAAALRHSFRFVIRKQVNPSGFSSGKAGKGLWPHWGHLMSFYVLEGLVKDSDPLASVTALLLGWR